MSSDKKESQYTKNLQQQLLLDLQSQSPNVSTIDPRFGARSSNILGGSPESGPCTCDQPKKNIFCSGCRRIYRGRLFMMCMKHPSVSGRNCSFTFNVPLFFNCNHANQNGLEIEINRICVGFIFHSQAVYYDMIMRCLFCPYNMMAQLVELGDGAIPKYSIRMPDPDPDVV